MSSTAKTTEQSENNLMPDSPPAVVRAADTTPGTNASGDWAVRLQGIGKQYRLGQLKSLNENFREDFVNWMKGMFTPGHSGADGEDSFWALRDIDLEVNRGDTIGIIGRNGAGKSTMLKILSRITQPTTGEISYRGRLASLLEVGTGFHRELTGRENIYLNGAILGMTKAEINASFDAIVDFAGVEKFLDTPVKRYSSGMYVRLAFAVAAHLRTDILVVDEVLAVGDAEFQKKCLGKMQDVASDGRTVFFVSHNMGAVENLCRKAVVLFEGQKRFDGDSAAAIKYYVSNHSVSRDVFVRFPDETAKIGILQSLRIDSEEGKTNIIPSGKTVVLSVGVRIPEKGIPKIGIGISDLTGKRIISISPAFQADEFFTDKKPGYYIAKCTIPGISLNEGDYLISAFSDYNGVKEAYSECLGITVIPSDFYGTGRLPTTIQSLYLEKGDWELLEEQSGTQE